MHKGRRDLELMGIFNNHSLSKMERIAALWELELGKHNDLLTATSTKTLHILR